MTIILACYLSGGSLDRSFGERRTGAADDAYGVLSLSVGAADRGSVLAGSRPRGILQGERQ